MLLGPDTVNLRIDARKSSAAKLTVQQARRQQSRKVTVSRAACVSRSADHRGAAWHVML